MHILQQSAASVCAIFAEAVRERISELQQLIPEHISRQQHALMYEAESSLDIAPGLMELAPTTRELFRDQQTMLLAECRLALIGEAFQSDELADQLSAEEFEAVLKGFIALAGWDPAQQAIEDFVNRHLLSWVAEESVSAMLVPYLVSTAHGTEEAPADLATEADAAVPSEADFMRRGAVEDDDGPA